MPEQEYYRGKIIHSRQRRTLGMPQYSCIDTFLKFSFSTSEEERKKHLCESISVRSTCFSFFCLSLEVFYHTIFKILNDINEIFVGIVNTYATHAISRMVFKYFKYTFMTKTK